MSRIHVGAVAVLLAATAAVQAAEPSAKRDYRAAMRDFVQAISTNAKKADPAFLVVPQGGITLLTDSGKPDGRPADAYLRAIDGVGQEEVFYGFDNQDNKKTPATEISESAEAKANPRKLKVSVSGLRSINDIAIQQLNKLAGLRIATVPFTGGGGEATLAALGGRVDGTAGFAPGMKG